MDYLLSVLIKSSLSLLYKWRSYCLKCLGRFDGVCQSQPSVGPFLRSSAVDVWWVGEEEVANVVILKAERFKPTWARQKDRWLSGEDKGDEMGFSCIPLTVTHSFNKPDGDRKNPREQYPLNTDVDHWKPFNFPSLKQPSLFVHNRISTVKGFWLMKKTLWEVFGPPDPQVTVLVCSSQG